MSLRVALYARLSLTTEESVSIERQLTAGRKFAEARGWTVIAEEVDDGVSATRKAPEAREGWRRILAAAPGLDAVVVWKVDRLARRVIDFLNADAALRAHGAGLVAVEDPIDMTTAQGRAFATMLAVFGEMEAASISARQRAARAHLISVGRAPGGRRPWAFAAVKRADGAGVDWRPIPEHAEAIRWAATEVIAGRATIQDVIGEWERRGLRPKEGRARWARTSVRRILASPTIAGATVHHGEVVRNPDQTMRIDPERAILDLATWRQLQAVIAARSTARAPLPTPSLLGALVHCAACHTHMHRRASLGTYVCGNRECGGPASVKTWIADAVATREFLERFGAVEIHAGRPAPAAADPVELATIADALEDVELALAETDLEDADALRLIRTRRDLRVRLATLQDAASGPPALVPFAATGQTYGAAWEAAEGVEARAALLAQVWAAVEVRRGRRGRPDLGSERFRFLEGGEVAG